MLSVYSAVEIERIEPDRRSRHLAFSGKAAGRGRIKAVCYPFVSNF